MMDFLLDLIVLIFLKDFDAHVFANATGGA